MPAALKSFFSFSLNNLSAKDCPNNNIIFNETLKLIRFAVALNPGIVNNLKIAMSACATVNNVIEMLLVKRL